MVTRLMIEFLSWYNRWYLNEYSRIFCYTFWPNQIFSMRWLIVEFHEKINSTESISALNTLRHFEYIILTLYVYRLTIVTNDMYREKDKTQENWYWLLKKWSENFGLKFDNKLINDVMIIVSCLQLWGLRGLIIKKE